MAELLISTDARNRRLDAMRDAIDAGGGPAVMTIYAGDTVLGTLTMGFPCAPSAVNGMLTFAPISEDPMALNKGRATRAVIATSSGDFVLQCDVSAPGKGGFVEINEPEVAMGGPIRVLSMTMTEPE